MKNILIIDDDEFILFGLSKAFSMQAKDCMVLTAQHGKQALEILGNRFVDVILTDLKMPVMNGYEVVHYVNENHPSIPIYVMTGDYLPDVTSRLSGASICRLVSKPFGFREVAAEILFRISAPNRLAI